MLIEYYRSVQRPVTTWDLHQQVIISVEARDIISTLGQYKMHVPVGQHLVHALVGLAAVVTVSSLRIAQDSGLPFARR